MPTPSPTERIQAHRAKKSAQMTMIDAFEIVKAGHTGSVKNFFKNAAVTGVRTMSTTSMVSTGTGVAIAAGVAIAGIVTGGLAIPVLIGLGAGTYAIKAAITAIGNDINRSNRNWLQRFSGATGADGKEMAAFLTCESGDAIRRAVDHYRMMVNTIIPNELKPQDEGQYATCEDAINHVKAVARFIHHGDKVRNYTLPVLDMLIFYLEQYDAMATVWATWEPAFKANLIAWFAAHPAGSCAATAKDVCYGPNASTGTFPWKPHAEGASNRTFPVGDAAPEAPPGAIEISELVAAMKAARAKVVSGMHVSSAKTWNYSAERPATSRARSNAVTSRTDTRETSKAHMQRARLEALIDAVWKQVDRPGYLARGSRRMQHWYTRHNKTEKLGAVLSEMISVGSIFMPFLKGADKLIEAGKYAVTAVSSSVTATTTLADSVGLGILKSKGAAPIQSGLLNRGKVAESVTADVRGAGLTVANMMPKLMLHFGRAAEAIKDLEESGTTIGSCSGAFGFCLQAAEVVHEMEKVGRYAAPCIGMVDVLAKSCDDWAEQENVIWRDMEAYVGEWVRDDEVHQACRDGGKKCYGSKHFKSGTNFLGRGGTWNEISNDPHNPI